MKRPKSRSRNGIAALLTAAAFAVPGPAEARTGLAWDLDTGRLWVSDSDNGSINLLPSKLYAFDPVTGSIVASFTAVLWSSRRRELGWRFALGGRGRRRRSGQGLPCRSGIGPIPGKLHGPGIRQLVQSARIGMGRICRVGGISVRRHDQKARSGRHGAGFVRLALWALSTGPGIRRNVSLGDRRELEHVVSSRPGHGNGRSRSDSATVACGARAQHSCSSCVRHWLSCGRSSGPCAQAARACRSPVNARRAADRRSSERADSFGKG